MWFKFKLSVNKITVTVGTFIYSVLSIYLVVKIYFTLVSYFYYKYYVL